MHDTPDEVALPGGHVGGAVRVGDTVRRPTGPWTPAVHALLDYLSAAGLAGVPRVHGYDDQGREILDFLPGRTFDTVNERVPDEVLAAGMRWLREYHRVVASYRPEGVVRWRNSAEELAAGQIICMHDFGAYNWVVDGNDFVGVIDWDMAGPGRPLDDIAFAAWNSLPLAIALPAPWVAARLRLMASAYGDGITAEDILNGAPARAMRSVRVIRAGQQAGDPGMLNLAKAGEPARTERKVAALTERLPAIAALL
ncbi:MAG TPA: phosphotransferase [Kribbellaceae bacterium]